MEQEEFTPLVYLVHEDAEQVYRVETTVIPLDVSMGKHIDNLGAIEGFLTESAAEEFCTRNNTLLAG